MMRSMAGLWLWAVLALSGCVSVEKVESGSKTLGERMTVTLEGAWNQLNAPGLGPAQVWTMEGTLVDQLLLYSGLPDNEAVHATGGTQQPDGERKTFRFRSTMGGDEIASLFQGMLTRDGSRYTLEKLEPMDFGGVKGFRFEFVLIRKLDNVRLLGRGYGAVSKGQLFAMLYMAPRLTFFARHSARVENIARSARIRE